MMTLAARSLLRSFFSIEIFFFRSFVFCWPLIEVLEASFLSLDRVKQLPDQTLFVFPTVS